MASSLQNATIKVRRDTAGNFTSNNPTLNQGEWAYETDTGKVKIGDGSTAWTSLGYITDVIAAITLSVSGTFTASALSALTTVTVSNGIITPFMHVQDQKASSTAGGTFTLGAWRTRDLNTAVINTITSASLGSNQITLPAGTYYLEGSAPGYKTGRHNTRWRNTTDSTDDLDGQTAFTSTGADSSETISNISGRFTIIDTKVFELQHRSQATQADNGFGIDSGTGFAVNTEIYSDVKIWKLA